MSSGGDDTVINNTSIPEWVKPYAENYVQRSQQVADMPYQAYQGQTVAQMNPFTTAAYNAQAQRAIQGSGVNNAAASELQKTLSGGYLNNNPYLDKQVDLASQDVLRNFGTVAARSGSFGNSGVDEATARALGDVSTNIRGADYARERSAMTNAIGMAPTIAAEDYKDADMLARAGQGFQQAEQANLTDQYNRFAEARGYPREQLNILGQGLGMNFGSKSTSAGPAPNTLAQGLGAGLAAYGAYNSGSSGGSK